MLTDRKHFGFYSKRAGGIPAHGEKLVSYLGLVERIIASQI
ncbi:hypothetical protein [Bacillus smithii]|nr:hypothetical protein [Bacillus smithii]MED1456918.1 hypothetical protein [Bacillus smithii]